MFECLKSWHTKLKIGKPFGMLARFMARWHVYWHIACRSKKFSRFRYALGTLARRPRWHAGTYDEIKQTRKSSHVTLLSFLL